MNISSDAFTITIVCAVICTIISGILGLVWLFRTQHSHPLGTRVKRFIGLSTIESFVTPVLVAATIQWRLTDEGSAVGVAVALIPTGLIALGLILAPLSSLSWEHPTFQRLSLQIMIIGLIRIALAIIIFLDLAASSQGFGIIISMLILTTMASWFVFKAMLRQIQALNGA